MTDMIERAVEASHAAGEAYLATLPARLDQRPNGWRRTLARVRARAAIGVVREPLFAAEDALEALRRCHGLDVTALCYPAVNLVRDACDSIRRADILASTSQGESSADRNQSK